jgi:hypothetical protein
VLVVQRRCTLYDLLIYPQRDRAGFFFGYCFYRNEVVLLGEAQYPAHSDIHEPKVPVIIYVDVRHMTDEAGPGVEDAPLAQFALGGRGCWVKSSRVRFMGFPFPSAVRERSSPRFTTVRSGAIRPSVRPVFRYPKKSGGRDPSPSCQ